MMFLVYFFDAWFKVRPNKDNYLLINELRRFRKVKQHKSTKNYWIKFE